jgi:hypothetical protein
MQDVLSLLTRDPALSRLNAAVQRNAGYAKSLQDDAARPRPAKEGR